MPLSAEEKASRILESVDKTGYDLEFYVQNELRKKRWNVISSRYYIDDIKEIEREIDIIAYKAYTVGDIVFYFTLVISCKKRSDSAWVFLTSPRIEDVNFDNFPVSLVSSDKRLDLLINTEKRMIIDALKENDEFLQVYDSDKRVFAYYQVNTSSGRCEDSKAIYDSIITAIKAMECELKAHQKYKVDEKRTFFCFNLLSIFEGEMYEIAFDEHAARTLNEVDQIKYINRHIVNGVEKFYRVHFIKKDAFNAVLEQYQNLAREGRRIFPELIDEFYNDIWNHSNRVDLIMKEFTLLTKARMKRISLRNQTERWEDYSFDDFSLSIVNKGERIEIWIKGFTAVEQPLVDFCNEDPDAKKEFSEILECCYRYQGEFEFLIDELPF